MTSLQAPVALGLGRRCNKIGQQIRATSIPNVRQRTLKDRQIIPSPRGTTINKTYPSISIGSWPPKTSVPPAASHYHEQHDKRNDQKVEVRVVNIQVGATKELHSLIFSSETISLTCRRGFVGGYIYDYFKRRKNLVASNIKRTQE